jgi:hypothetical protein
LIRDCLPLVLSSVLRWYVGGRRIAGGGGTTNTVTPDYTWGASAVRISVGATASTGRVSLGETRVRVISLRTTVPVVSFVRSGPSSLPLASRGRARITVSA